VRILDESRYYALVASLPALPELERAEQTPINAIKLRTRLADLTAPDRNLLDRVESLLHWERLRMDTPDAALIAAASAAMPTLAARGLDDLVRDRLELRTVIAALRRKQAGQAPPGPGEVWGFGRHRDLIRRSWDRSDLGLSHVFPAVRDIAGLIRDGDPDGLERFLLVHVWRALARAGEGHYFDFRAVVIYVLRWNILDRWLSYDGAAAAERFELLCNDALTGISLEMGAIR